MSYVSVGQYIARRVQYIRKTVTIKNEKIEIHQPPLLPEQLVLLLQYIMDIRDYTVQAQFTSYEIYSAPQPAIVRKDFVTTTKCVR